MLLNESTKRTRQRDDGLATFVDQQQEPLDRYGWKVETPPVEKIHPFSKQQIQVFNSSGHVSQSTVPHPSRIKLLESSSQIRLPPLWQPPTQTNEEVLQNFEDMIHRLRSEVAELHYDADADDDDSDSDPNATEDDVSIADSLCAGYLEKQGMQRVRHPSIVFSGQSVQADVDGLLQSEWGITRNIVSSRTA